MKRFFLPCAALLAVAACSAAPTEPVGFDAAPAHRSEAQAGSGTGMVGSGNFSGSASTTQSDTTGRGPNMMGSGN